MNSSFQARIQSEEERLELYRERRFRGSARVHLNCLAFDDSVDRHMDNGRNATRLENILEIQGCLRIHRDYHVPVLVDAVDWGHRFKFIGTQEETFPELYVPLGTSLRAQRHRSIIAAARKMLKSPSNQWWIVDVYVADPVGNESNGSGSSDSREAQRLESRFLRSLREPCLVDRRPPDGLIYYNIRCYQGNRDGRVPDKSAEDDWWVMLRAEATSRKHEYLRRFLRHGSFPQAFDALLPIPGLWSDMSIGVLHSLIALRCDEEILDYLEYIRHIWFDRILGGDADLAAHADAGTVKKLQSRVPMVSSRDLKFLGSSTQTEDLKEDLFPSLREDGTRKAIWNRLQTIGVPIPTLGTFFKDILYLGVARRVMRELFIGGGDPETKISVDEEVAGLHRTVDGNTRLQASSRTAVRHGIQVLWRFAFQYGHEMTGTDRQAARGPAAKQRATRPTWSDGSGPVDRLALWQHFFWLANEHGFKVPAHATPQRNPSLLQVPEPCDGDGDGGGQDEPLSRRCGRPFADTADADRFALSREALAQNREVRKVTPGLVRQSQFRAFFRHLGEDSEFNESANLPNEPVPAADMPASTPGDDAIMHNPNGATAQSPAHLQCLDYPGLFDSCGFDISALPTLPQPNHFSVQVFIPSVERKDISIPNDGRTVKEFYNGLKERYFTFSEGNRGIEGRDTDFYMWHSTNPTSTVQAQLSEESVRAYEPSPANSNKRKRMELADKISAVARWVDEQQSNMAAVFPTFRSA